MAKCLVCYLPPNKINFNYEVREMLPYLSKYLVSNGFDNPQTFYKRLRTALSQLFKSPNQSISTYHYDDTITKACRTLIVNNGYAIFEFNNKSSSYDEIMNVWSSDKSVIRPLYENTLRCLALEKDGKNLRKTVDFKLFVPETEQVEGS